MKPVIFFISVCLLWSALPSFGLCGFPTSFTRYCSDALKVHVGAGIFNARFIANLLESVIVKDL